MALFSDFVDVPLARGLYVAVVGLLLDVVLAVAPPPHQVGHVANTGSVLQ